MDDQTFLNQLAEKLSKLGTVRPLGFHYLHPYETVPADSIICNGATYSRALYKDFFDYITTQGWVKTEAEWQEIATRDNGFCPFYSAGDGSTNFRTPKFAPYQQIAMEVAQATQYHQAGLPNVEGSITGVGLKSPTNTQAFSGAFKQSKLLSNTYTGNSQYGGKILDETTINASDYNEIYGISNTVQPESHSWVMCVVAYGIATNVGSVDIQNVMSAVNAVQAKVDNKLEAGTVHITETWKSTDGNSWYRKWSDGWIEQGGYQPNIGEGKHFFTFPKAFRDMNYTVVASAEEPKNKADANVTVAKETTTKVYLTTQGYNYKTYLYACGY